METLRLAGPGITGVGLANFKDCVNLTYLDLAGPRITEAGLAHFRACRKLTSLALEGPGITDGGLDHFKDCHLLTTVALQNTQISDPCLERLAGYPKLTVLNVKNTKVTETGVKKLAAALPQCKIEWDGGVIEPPIVPKASAAPSRQPKFQSGNWSIEGDVLLQTSTKTPALLIFGDMAWTDGDFTCDVWHTKEDVSPTLVVRAVSERQHIYADFGSWANTGSDLQSVRPGPWQRLKLSPCKIPIEQWVPVKLQLRGKEITVFVDGKEISRGEDDTRLSGAIGLRTFGGPARYRNIRFIDPEGKVLWEGLPEFATSPSASGSADPAPSDYDKLATGRWVPVLRAVGPKVAVRNAQFENGLIRIQDGHAYDSSIMAQDLIVRAKVQKLRGQNVMLTLRDVLGVYYSAAYRFDDSEGFGVGMRGPRFRYGVKQEFTGVADVQEGEFFELAFAAIGDTLTVYANGKQLGQIRDVTISRGGGVAVHATKGQGVFKDVELMVLDKPADTLPEESNP